MIKKEKTSLDVIVEIIWLYLNKKSQRQISEILKINRATVFRKIKKYNLLNDKFKNDKELLKTELKKLVNPVLDLTNKKFGKLTAKYQILNDRKETCWYCECECGKNNIVRWEYLINKRSQSCGCLRSLNTSKRKSKNPIKVNQNYIYLQYVNGAKKRNLIFNLSFDECIKYFSGNCHYCGCKPLTRVQKHSNKCNREDKNVAYFYNGIDRIDSTKHYTVDNCVSCCKICNRGKSDMLLQDFLSWINNLKEKAIQDFILKERDDNVKNLSKCNSESETNCSNCSNSG